MEYKILQIKISIEIYCHIKIPLFDLFWFLPDRIEADFRIQNLFPASVSYLAYSVDFFWTKHVTIAELLEKETEAFLIWPCKKEQHSRFRILDSLFIPKL